MPFAILASAVMAQTSYLMRMVFHLDSYTPILILLWLIVFIWLLFRVHPFYSFLMSVSGYLGYVVIQCVVLIGLQIWIPIEDILTPLLHLKLMQLLCSVITLAIAIWLNQKRLGFIFVPDDVRVKVKLTGLNLILFCISVAGSLIITGVVHNVVKRGYVTTAVGAGCLLTILIILNFAYKKEMGA
ncbi:hypothetical protein GE107_14545 [Cohnella sp. CFH 77786]|uniref:hypothetical protein n=1 Tax=Cohnella sp. CFH 77786 TaxID=2662265 RepID=UPI001C609D38|nr:hypothetical protein [Cohnella sp. CFH 77786]MBW5447272.1 hypothetical protein [Cohnella sp. CFH 77786]